MLSREAKRSLKKVFFFVQMVENHGDVPMLCSGQEEIIRDLGIISHIFP